MTSKIRVTALLGPTAAGKTAIAIEVAQKFNLEIISCDSRQIYRGMDIGTAKPSAMQRGQVRHWMIDIVDPDSTYSAYSFAQCAEEIIRRAHAKGKGILIVGGTGFYYRSLSRGLGPKVGADSNLRAFYAQKSQKFGPDSIFEELRTIDPESARILHPRDVRRCIRALEVYHSTGRTLSELKRLAFPPRDITFHACVVGWPRSCLYQRIDERVDRMAQEGLWEEFQALLDKGYDRSSPGLQCVGYRELFEVKDGCITFREALSKIKQNTRRYAKRQITWFRHQLDAPHFDMSEEGACKRVIEWIGEQWSPAASE